MLTHIRNHALFRSLSLSLSLSLIHTTVQLESRVRQLEQELAEAKADKEKLDRRFLEGMPWQASIHTAAMGFQEAIADTRSIMPLPCQIVDWGGFWLGLVWH